MRCPSFLASPIIVAILSAAPAQEPNTVAQLPAGAQKSSPVIYYNDAEITAPELLPTVQSLASHHCKKIKGLPLLGEVVDPNGVPSRITVLRTGGREIDRAALEYAAAERFKPGVREGNPVSVAVELELEIEGCKQKTISPSGKNEEIVLAADPIPTLEVMPLPLPNPNMTAMEISEQISYPGVEHIDPGTVSAPRAVNTVSAPRPVNNVAARFSDSARKFKIQGTCLISMIVDANGDPKHIRLVKSLEPSLDQEALKAVAQYRFKPAMKKGQPVPVVITIEVNFRLF